jgi:hypothetical protein
MEDSILHIEKIIYCKNSLHIDDTKFAVEEWPFSETPLPASHR